jgi:aryl-alcohol dehydrogenase-like predicted oxidoreductase
MNDRLALGTVQFGLSYGVANQSGLVASEEASRIIAAAATGGMRTLDTAIAYGTSESVLGSCGVTGWEIVTKLPAIPDDCDDVQSWSLKQIEGSLTRLNVDSVHGVLLHRPDQLFGVHGSALLSALRLMQTRGYTKKIGVSIYAPAELNDILALGVFELVQAPLNILDRRLAESGWAKRLSELGVELHTRSVFLQGLLLMQGAQRPAKFNRWSSIWEEWARWLAVSGLSPVQACLRYVLSIGEVDRLVVGVDNLAHLQDILSAAAGTLPDLPNWPTIPEVELINPAHWNQL